MVVSARGTTSIARTTCGMSTLKYTPRSHPSPAKGTELTRLGVFPLLKHPLPVVVAFLLPATDTLDHRRVGNGTHRHGLLQEPMEELPAMA